ncbi:MAG: hypothetical protein AB8B97_04780 [Granulosicoccus sp.]
MKVLLVRSLAVSLCLINAVAAANNGALSVTQPDRAFGYTIGDIVEQTIGLQAGDITHTLTTLPETQREGRWVTRQGVELHQDGEHLTIRYQIVNSPPDVRLVSLPALTLSTDQGRVIEVPEWSFSIAPLTPAVTDSDNQLPFMQADWTPVIPPATELWRNIKLLSAALCLSLLLWLAWWMIRGLREAGTLPFAHAYRIIRRHKPTRSNDDAPAWLALHRAFDQMSGRSVNNDSIDKLIQTAEWLEPFEPDIRSFYKTSSERFFAHNKPPASFDITGLSKRLYKAEKRHTSKLPKKTLAAHGMP